MWSKAFVIDKEEWEANRAAMLNSTATENEASDNE
jgi:hypothetical protein